MEKTTIYELLGFVLAFLGICRVGATHHNI